MINDASIYSAIVIFMGFFPLLLYFLIKGKKNLPAELYHGRYLVFALISFFSYLALVVLALFFSNDYGVIARLLGWLILSHSAFALQLVGWINFTMHGYELRYLFKKIVTPCYMNVLTIIIFWLTILFSLNYWAAIPLILFTIFSLLWAQKAYKLTKPPIDEDIPLHEEYEP